MSDLLQETIKRNTQIIKDLNIGGLGSMSVKRIAEALANAEVDTYESDYMVLQQQCEKANFNASIAKEKIKVLEYALQYAVDFIGNIEGMLDLMNGGKVDSDEERERKNKERYDDYIKMAKDEVDNDR